MGVIVDSSLTLPDYHGQRIGPFARNGLIYAVLKDDTAKTIEVWRSADSGVIWTEMDSANHLSMLQNGMTGFNQENFSVCRNGPAGDILYVAYIPTGGTQITVTQFDMSTETWGASITNGPEPQIDTGASEASYRRWFLDYRETDGALVILFTGPALGSLSQTYYEVYTGSSWSSQANCGLTTESTLPTGILALPDGRVYFFMQVFGIIGVVTLIDRTMKIVINQLDTAGTLGTPFTQETGSYDNDHGLSTYRNGVPAFRDDSGTYDSVMPFVNDSGGGNAGEVTVQCAASGSSTFIENSVAGFATYPIAGSTFTNPTGNGPQGGNRSITFAAAVGTDLYVYFPTNLSPDRNLYRAKRATGGCGAWDTPELVQTYQDDCPSITGMGIQTDGVGLFYVEYPSGTPDPVRYIGPTVSGGPPSVTSGAKYRAF